jgi:hypothetical protein
MLSHENFYAFINVLMYATCPAHLTLFDIYGSLCEGKYPLGTY